MKLSIILITVGLTVSVSAYACPNLAGVYSCPANQSNPASVITVTQGIQGSVCTYTSEVKGLDGKIMESDSIVADGIAHPFTDPSTQLSGTQKYTTNDTSLRLDMSYAQPQVGLVTAVLVLNLDTQANLHEVADVTAGSYGTFHTDRICTH